MAAPSIVTPSLKHKLVLLGDQSVGKTSIITRFIYDTFDQQYQATIGIDFFSKNIVLDGRTTRLHLWDTAGQERFRSLIPNYIRNSACAVVVYDVTQRATFVSSFSWIDSVREVRGEDVLVFLVGNKSDLGDPERREVSVEEAEQRAKACGALFMEVSAKNGRNIQRLFKAVVQALALRSNHAAEEMGSHGGQGSFNATGDPFVVTPSAMREADNRIVGNAGANDRSRCSC